MPRPRSSRGSDLLSDLAHGAAGLGISVLGVAVGVGVMLTGTAQATDVVQRAEHPGPDVTRAEPMPSAEDIDRETRADRSADRDGGGRSDEGSLERYEGPGREPDQNPVRKEMQKGVSKQQEKERRQRRAAEGEDVSEKAREEIGRTRAQEQQSDKDAVAAEQRRLEEEKRKKEEEERRRREEEEERRKGTLRDGKYEGTYEGPSTEEPGPASGSGGAAPVTGHYTIAARWGQVGSWSRYHTGIDLSAPIGRPVVAAAGGVVRAPVGGGWAGTHVIIEHSNGDATLYAHLAGASVRPGQTVQAGQVIGSIGMTGRTFGPHLHFEYYPSVKGASNPYTTSDPYTWMLTRGVRL